MLSLPRSLTAALRDGGGSLTVLVVRLGALGDVLRTLPPVRLLRRAAPRARIHWVVDDRWASVLDGHPDLTGVIRLPRKEWRRLGATPAGWPGLLRSVLGFRRELAGLGADLALDFHGNLRSGISVRMSGSPVRIGYAGHQQKEGNRWFTTHRVPAGERRTPRMERNLELVRALGVSDAPLPDGGLPMIRQGAAAAARIAGTCLRAGTTGHAVIAPGASAAQAYKKPPAELLAAATRRIASAGLTPLVVWGPGEEGDARRVVDCPDSRAIYAPPTDLPTLAALLAGARLFVGGDSGPLHLACAAGCPVVGLYGATDPRVNRPWGVPFRVVHADHAYSGIKREDRRFDFTGLDDSTVAAAVDSLLTAADG